MKLNQDINNLRAIAVMSVICYHFRPDLAPAGFYGVDIFFTISGFLIWKKIASQSTHKNLIFNFYKDRINRIIPPLAIMLSVLMALGYHYSNSIDYEYLGKQAAYTSAFLSNIFFSGQTGYFTNNSHEKILQHTWSLSIEVQYYILTPLILTVLLKIRHQRIRVITITTILASIYYQSENTDNPQTYFSSMARAWEFATGVLLAQQAKANISGRTKEIIKITSWLLMPIILTTGSQDQTWELQNAIIAVASCGCIIHFSTENTESTKHTTYKTISFILKPIGLASYSLYIWHWPIIAIYKLYQLPYSTISGIPITLLAGLASHKYIERNPALTKNKNSWIINILLIILTFTAGEFISRTNGVPERLSNEAYEANLKARAALNEKPTDFRKTIILEDRTKYKGNILIIGASHAQTAYFHAIEANQKYDVYFHTEAGCFITPSSNSHNKCTKFQNSEIPGNGIIFEKAVIFLYCFYCGFSKDLQVRNSEAEFRYNKLVGFIHKIKDRSAQIYIVMPEPFGDAYNPKKHLRLGLEINIDKQDVIKHFNEHYNAIDKIKNLELPFINFIDPLDFLCSESSCKTTTEDGDFIYYDDSHMRPSYAKSLMSYLDRIYE